ncbi:MAG TPA: membrane protein insertase YidC [Casimicrobiaceae bacterium]|nr:membrane protein insertase YidC [Casimicrobiaceae bacterium]
MMDTQRVILFLVFSFSLMFLWEAWQKHVNPPAPVTTKSATPSIPAAPQKPADVPAAVPSAGTAGVAIPAAPAGTPTATQGEAVTVKTDLYTATIDAVGGVISEVALATHRDATDRFKPYKVIQRGEQVSLAQAGLLGEGLPNHRTAYRVLPGPRELQPGADKLEVKLAATAVNGNPVVQTLTFHRGSYVIDSTFEIRNTTSEPVSPFAYFQLSRDTKTALPQSSWTPVAYTGPVVYSEADNFKKVDFGEVDKLAADPKRKPPFTPKADNGWVGMIEHYFVTAWLPPQESKVAREFYVRKLDGGLYSVGMIVPLPTVAPGATASTSMRLYAGPQEQDVIGKLAPGFDLVVDYGIFTVLAAPLFWLLKWLHGLIGNWGWAIVVMTIIIKMCFYPLNAAAARSMGKMKIVGPKLKSLQEQYSNDKQQLQIKMMELYKQEKINPLGGCLPILVQIPVFIALYWVLLSAVELRYAPWIGWIHDLSAPDPWFVLPVLYAITAYLQVKLSPTPITDPMQARIMQIMPVAFSVLFIFFPSGLVLYWLVNNILQIAQQWQMNRMLENEAALVAAKRR